MVKFYIFILILPGKTGREEPIGNKHDTPINNKGLTKVDIGPIFLILWEIKYKIRIDWQKSKKESIRKIVTLIIYLFVILALWSNLIKYK